MLVSIVYSMFMVPCFCKQKIHLRDNAYVLFFPIKLMIDKTIVSGTCSKVYFIYFSLRLQLYNKTIYTYKHCEYLIIKKDWFRTRSPLQVIVAVQSHIDTPTLFIMPDRSSKRKYYNICRTLCGYVGSRGNVTLLLVITFLSLISTKLVTSVWVIKPKKIQ